MEFSANSKYLRPNSHPACQVPYRPFGLENDSRGQSHDLELTLRCRLSADLLFHGPNSARSGLPPEGRSAAIYWQMRGKNHAEQRRPSRVHLIALACQVGHANAIRLGNGQNCSPWQRRLVMSDIRTKRTRRPFLLDLHDI